MNWPRATASTSARSGPPRGSAPGRCRSAAAAGRWRRGRRRRPRGRRPSRSRPPPGTGPAAVRRSAPRYAALPSALPEVAGEGPDVRPGRAARRRARRSGGPGRVLVPRQQRRARGSSPAARRASTVSPARAIAYARRPPTLMAEYAGGRCEIGPVSPGRAASTSSRVGAGPVAGVSSPSRSSVDDEAPKQTVARYALPIGEMELDDPRPAAEEQRQDARRERIQRPAVADALRRGQPADEADDVVRGRADRLVDDEDAVEAGPEGLVRHGQRATSAARRPASARTAGRAWSTGSSTVAPAARACPPPPNCAGQHGGVDPAGLRPDADPRRRAGLLEQDRHLGLVGLGEQVDDPLGLGGQRAGRGEVGVEQGRIDRRARRRRQSSRSSTRPNSRSCAAGLERYSRREMSDSGAPASTSAADTASVRGVAFGWANVAVSMTMPAISAAARAPSPASSGRPSRVARSATISQVAAAFGSIQSASPAASFEAWWSMTTRGSRSKSSGVAAADIADPVERAAIGHDEQVVRRASDPGRCGSARRRRGSRTAAGPGPCRPGRRVPPSDSTMRTMPSVAPSVSASGFSWPTARTRRAPRSRSTTTSGTASRYGAEVDGHRRRPGRGFEPAFEPGTRAGLRSRIGGVRGAWAGSPPTAAPRARRPRDGRGRPGSAASRRAAGRRRAPTRRRAR